MPESEDDHERRNRDKFVREREYIEKPRGRDFNMDRNRRDYSNGSGIKRGSGRRDDEPPLVKRNRFDSASDSFEPQFNRKEENNASVMLTFRKFLNTQDEMLSDEEAIAKYLEYKIEFKKQECETFFQQHKDEEWFCLKYHPEESKAHKEQQQAALRKRLEIFNFFFENGLIEKTNLEYLNAANILRLLDSIIIKLEDGDDSAIEELNNLKDEELEDESIAEVAKIKEKLTVSKEVNGINNDLSKSNHASSTAKNENEKKDEIKNGEENLKKNKFYKTCSIHFKTIPSNTKIADLENMCKQHPGFIRIGLTDPLPDSKQYRHGWVSYRRDVNIKEIFWSLKNAKLGGFELGAVVNRDLKQRVRPISSIVYHRSITQNYIRLAAKLITLYDYKARLFCDPEASFDLLEDLDKAIIDSKNPILKSIVDYMVEEECAEEESLLGLNSFDEAKIPLEIDNALLKVLDKLILYLRIVHSIDFYNTSQYLNEDNMPNRVSILHVRNVEPSKDDNFVSVENSKIFLVKKFVKETILNFNERLTSSLLRNSTISEEDLEKLGKKDAEKAVEDFINQNCVELQKDKWLCPLSGKKFKGAEFIRKHLQSKHEEKLNEVKDEVLYFNNYLSDPSRPHIEQPKRPASPALQLQSTFISNSLNQGNFAGSDFDKRLNDTGYRNWNNNNQRSFGNNRGFQGGNRSRYFDPLLGGGNMDNGGRRDPRQQIAYRDLDAPEDIF